MYHLNLILWWYSLYDLYRLWYSSDVTDVFKIVIQKWLSVLKTAQCQTWIDPVASGIKLVGQGEGEWVASFIQCVSLYLCSVSHRTCDLLPLAGRLK